VRAHGAAAVTQHRVALLLAQEVGVMAWFLILIEVAVRLPARTASRVRGLVGRVAGVVLVGFGGWLGVSALM
jgi:hypothetical protein